MSGSLDVRKKLVDEPSIYPSIQFRILGLRINNECKNFTWMD